MKASRHAATGIGCAAIGRGKKQRREVGDGREAAVQAEELAAARERV